MNKKVVTLKKLLIYEAIVLLLMGAFMFVVETRVTESKQRENLMERLDSLQEAFNKAYQETEEVTALYEESVAAKADALVMLYEQNHDLGDYAILKDVFNIDEICVAGKDTMNVTENYLHYTSIASDGTAITVGKARTELDTILNNIFTENKILQRIVSLDDMFLVVTNPEGTIRYYNDESYINQNITVLGIEMSDLQDNVAKWLRINKQMYYTSCITNQNLSLKICCGISSNNMTLNSHIAISLIFGIVCIIFTIVYTYIYFCKQQNQKNWNNENYSLKTVTKKMRVFTLIGLFLIGLTTYYVQTLFYLSMHSLAIENEISEIEAAHEEAQYGAQQITKIYDASYLNKAQSTAYILSAYPELRTKADLARISDFYDLEFVMLFDTEGKEYLSDSYIIGFEISDDPADQSYAFNVLKNGVPYVIQEAQNDELTNTYRKYIGVLTYSQQGEMDGFLQIAVSPENLQKVMEEVSLNKTLESTIAGTDDEAFAIDAETGLITFSSNPNLIGKQAVDFGFKESQLRDNFYGTIKIDGTEYYLNSFVLDGHIIYVGDQVRNIYAGRALITFISQVLSLVNLVLYTVYIRGKKVEDALEPIDSPYVDVTTADGEQKQAVNIISRVMRQKIMWADKTPEDKTAYISRIIIMCVSVLFIIVLLLRDHIYTRNSIFGFIISGRWERGLNVFALTEVLLCLFQYVLVINVARFALDEIIKLVTPKNETVIRLLKSFIRYVLTIGVGYYSLSLLGFDSQSLLASAGLLTLVVGLGAKDLVTDILAGVFIIFENEFQVGDIIEVDGYKGRVLEIGIRTTRVMNTIQDIKSINNRNLTNIVNKTKRNSYCDVIVNVQFDQDIDMIEKLLNEELPKIKEKSPYIISGPTYGGIDDMSTRSMRLSIRTECVESKKFEVRTIVNHEIAELFAKNGIKMW